MRGFSAEVMEAGEIDGTWLVQPRIVEVTAAAQIPLVALAATTLKPEVGDVVFCIETMNDYDHTPQQRINDPGGATLIIVGVFSEVVNFAGEVILGEGTYKMVLGEPLGVWAAKVDAAINALYAWGATGLPPGGAGTGGIAPFPGTPPAPAWVAADNLSQRNKLD